MKCWEIFRFELTYQLRRPWPWLFLVVMVVFAFFSTRIAILPVTLPQDFILNSPFIITSVTVFSCQIWLLLAPAVAGEAAARDRQTRMHPLLFTSPVRKAEYLGGRFGAAFALQALILLGVQVGSLLAVYGPGANPELTGPFRPEAYLAAYGFLALTNALVATSFQFAFAMLTGRPMASYLGSLVLFFLSYPVTLTLYGSRLHHRALLADPIGILAIMNEMMSNWTIVEKNVRSFTLEGPMLWNRLLWVGIALGMLAILYRRVRLVHPVPTDWWSQFTPRFTTKVKSPAPTGFTRLSRSIPPARQSFGFRTNLGQTLAVARRSFQGIAMSPGGLFLLLIFPMLVTFTVLVKMQHWGVPLLPRTAYLLTRHLTGVLTSPTNYWVMVPLFTIYYAGELVWRERDAGLSESVDATPVPEWVLFLGKLLGLGLILATLMGIMIVVGLTVQVIRGYYPFEIMRYVQVLLGLKLVDYLLFATLAMTVQAVVNQKYLGQLFTLIAYLVMVFSSFLGIEHPLLVYASGPEWYFTDMRGVESSLGPWLWFRLYWAAWAVLLAVIARLLWVRGKEQGLASRLKIVRLRYTRATAGFALLAVGLLLSLGGFIFYNTNVRHAYVTDDEQVQRRADYERHYGKYEGIAQPTRVATHLHIEIYPDRREATIRGSYRLVNRTRGPITSVHLEPAFYVKTRMRFDRPARAVVADEKLGHFIYALGQPLQPGDSLTLRFEVTFEARGFDPRGLGSTGAGQAILENGTYFTGDALPIIGYQSQRELWGADDRRKHGLPRQVTLPDPGDIDPRVAADAPAIFEAIIGTSADQVAVAPGELRRTWHQGERRYFQYGTDVPIIGRYVFFSANYKVHRERWKHVDLQVYVHPGHTEHLNRLLRSIRASLAYYSAQFGPYPHRFLQVIEQPGNFMGMGVDGSGVITGGEGFFQLDPKGAGFDALFEIMAHEMGHQWWGMQLQAAFAEGGGVISESLAWYSAMQLVKKVKGREALRQFMSIMRQPDPWPPMRTGLPLLRAMDPWANYRKGPYAMHALSEYVGEARVNRALRRLIEKKVSSLATTIDLYRELQAVTPDSLKPLLHDLFEVNAIWTFNTRQATAKQTAAGHWQVTFEVEAQKVVADSAGVETKVPVNGWVEIGVFARAQPGQKLGKPLYLRKHFIHSGKQTIIIMVPQKPARGGIDPYSLLDWEEGDNIEEIQ
ncbi:peptidase M1-like protein [Larkinella arboricola]|uniref:Peptidase M1-like protein n=1 Tax=Larkinella arboricola TaxID=643671 RepID=A0A327WRD4_LARAB|nr:ABC transporter permease [Larkinella arboricola]RAJ93236.1 peptidase M1-like protein [Larkinella arboricola]